MGGLGPGSVPEEPPRVALARLLDRTLSEVVVFHARLVAPFLKGPPVSVTPQHSARALEAVREQQPLSLGELQKNVRLLRYGTVAAFKADAQRAAELLNALYAPSHPALADLALSMPVVLAETLAPHSRELAVAQAAVEPAEKREPWCREYPEAAVKLLGLAPWESYARLIYARVDPEWALDIDLPEVGGLSERAPRRECEDVFGAVIQALEAAKLLPADGDAKTPGANLLTPSRAEVEAMFEDHSARLRAALQSAARCALVAGAHAS